MFYKNYSELKYNIKLNDGDYKLIYEFTGSKEHLDLVAEVMQEEIIKKFRVKEKSNCGGCGDAVSKRS